MLTQTMTMLLLLERFGPSGSFISWDLSWRQGGMGEDGSSTAAPSYALAREDALVYIPNSRQGILLKWLDKSKGQTQGRVPARLSSLSKPCHEVIRRRELW